ncbi:MULTISPECIES: hypothetical protein [unclassified Saccharopolyspora]|uniref:hypothetical protein n=1 Tax=Saccharopolyspora TaxID=1835 RepID=UPI0027DC83F9|nr:hypothetical protein [Saccharopolyspora sp. HNM0986]
MRAPFSNHRPTGAACTGRRDVLRLLAALPAAAAVSALTTACGSGQDAPDPLEPLAASARSDAALAQGIARAHAELAGQAGAVAAMRGEHARALEKEIDRLDPPDPDRPKRRGASAPQVPGSSAAAKEALRRSLAVGQQEAAKACPRLPGYRAGLTGSVSAGCAGLTEVLA